MSSDNSTKTVFEDFQINVKLKISALWVAVMFCYVYGDYIQIFVPGVIAKSMELTTTAADVETQLGYVAIAVLMAIPSLMIFFSLVLRPIANRRLNIGVCIFFILTNVLFNLTETWAFYLLLTTIEVTISIAILWYAWTWPKTTEVE